ncbi:beta-propeller fold lactonase family protein [Buchnera aphidicola]|uniref:6-phosphogluconolactonase n=1 Tax=Buchnera aphidicola (Anoecia oenotherae) TaxID=1241833 RepID=A0A4D6XPV5_9GAMM|nr:beta-propeller fold lactonase family protein [Buchnera aphidicola]QCI19352.1 6-phosphogluconolactonase [Buchnera aphidicola (Anoecia oenotherae)]
MDKYIYISSPGDSSIKVLKFFKKNITIVQEIYTEGQAQPISLSKKYKLMYVGIRPNYNITTYKILNNGKIKKLSTFSLPVPLNYISINKENNLLACSSYHGSLLIIIKLNENGIPITILNIFKNINGCHCSKFYDLNHSIITTALKSDSIYIFNSINNKKNFKKLQFIVKKKSGPRHFTFHPNKNFIFSINELDSTIDVWKIKNDKISINNIQNIKLLPKEHNNSICNWAADIHISSCGKYLYASERNNSIITLFEINQNNFKIFFKKHYSVETQPRAFFIDKKENLLSVVGEKSNFITIYKISKNNGDLLPIIRSYAGENPVWVIMN